MSLYFLFFEGRLFKYVPFALNWAINFSLSVYVTKHEVVVTSLEHNAKKEKNKINVNIKLYWLFYINRFDKVTLDFRFIKWKS